MHEPLLFPLTMDEQFAQVIDDDKGTENRLAEYVYADWLDDQGDPRGEAWRVLMERGMFPRAVRSRNKGIRVSWRWYKYRYAFVPKYSQIGKEHFLQLPGIAAGDKYVVWTASSYFKAMNAAAIAWVRVERDPFYLRFN